MDCHIDVKSLFEGDEEDIAKTFEKYYFSHVRAYPKWAFVKEGEEKWERMEKKDFINILMEEIIDVYRNKYKRYAKSYKIDLDEVLACVRWIEDKENTHGISLRVYELLENFPICDGKRCGTGKRVPGKGRERYLCDHNNFAHVYPQYAKQWDYERNEGKPSDYSYGSRKIFWWICDKGCGCHRWQTSISNRVNRGCPFCCGQKVCPDHESLAALRLDLMKEWDYDSNEQDPKTLTTGSNYRVWWICDKGCGCHRWQAIIHHRTSGTGCPFCCGQKFCSDHESLKVLHKNLIEEWDWERNEISPDNVGSGSSYKVHWICSVKGNAHRWEARICDRTSGTGCPHCCHNGYSKKAMKWLRSIEEEFDISLQHAESPDGEYKIPSVGKVDGYHLETKTVYEYHGSYWHGDPVLFHPEDINERSGKTFGELYEKTIKREDRIRSLGYNLVVRWESEDM